MLRVCSCTLSLVLCVGVALLAPAGSTARAELVTTRDLLTTPEGADARARLVAFLDREDVAQQIEALGVDREEARARVGALSDQEAVQLSQRLDSLPAGGSFLGVVAAILVTILLVLVISDLFGWTDVFPFVRPLPRGPHNP